MDDRHYALAVDQQVGRSGSTYETVRGFLNWRKQQPALLRGSIEVWDEPADLLAFSRTSEDQQLLLCFNLSAHPVKAAIPDEWNPAKVVSGVDEVGVTQAQVNAGVASFPAYSMLALQMS